MIKLEQRTYNISEYARLNKVSRNTVKKWIELGDIEYKILAGKTRIIGWTKLLPLSTVQATVS